MAAKRLSTCETDYVQLHNFSSVVLYDNAVPRKKKGKIYEVERIISRKKEKKDFLYLIKWAGWSLQSCTWEPSAHLPSNLLRGYERPPKPVVGRLESLVRAFSCGILSMLKSKAIGKGQLEIDHDCWRYVMQGKGKPSEHKGYFLYEKNDFGRLPMLPPDWWYYLNEHGEGKKIDFPMKIKAVLLWSSKKHIVKGTNVVEGPRFPIEKLSIFFARLPCSQRNLFN